MAKGKYQQWLEPDNLTLLKGFARNGYTDEDIAQKWGLVQSLFMSGKAVSADS